MTIYNKTMSDFIQMVPPSVDPMNPPSPGDLALAESRSLATTLWREMKDHGFQIIGTNVSGATDIDYRTTKVIFQPTAAIDPLISQDPDSKEWKNDWRIMMWVDGSAKLPPPVGSGSSTDVTVTNTTLKFSIGTIDQIKMVGNVPTDLTVTKYTVVPQSLDGTTSEKPRIWSGNTMSFSFTSAERGFVFAVWNTNSTDDFQNSAVVCIQRPVGCGGLLDKGATGQKPLFMVTNLCPITASSSGANSVTGTPGPKNNWYYQVIREVDTVVPSPNWANYGDNAGVVNGYRFTDPILSDDQERLGNSLNWLPTQWLAPVISDTNQYHLIFPYGLCTNRFAYSDEMDLLAISKADAYRTLQEIPLNVYNEGGDRTYTALFSNSSNMKFIGGVRVFILSNGSGA